MDIPANYVPVALLVWTLFCVAIFIFGHTLFSHAHVNRQFRIWWTLGIVCMLLGGGCFLSLNAISPVINNSAREAANLAMEIYEVIAGIAMYRWIFLLKGTMNRRRSPE